MLMNLEMAKKLLRAGIEKAKEMGRVYSIALVDENGWLVALHRMDGAPTPTVDIARDKAWTAATFQRPSSEVAQFGDPRAPGYGLNAQNWNDRLTTIPGGMPIWDENHLIGAIGVCSENPEEDITLCQKVIEEMGSRHTSSFRGADRQRRI
jgi:uncharacterized protein GlcG (DUF336 family)